MKNITVILTFLAIVALGLGSATTADSPMTKATVITGLASMPLTFTENQGQWDGQVLFRANAGGATMWFTKSGAYYQFTRHIGVGQDPRGPDISDHDVGTTGVPTYRGTDVTQPGEPVSGVEGWPDQPARGRQMSTSAPFSDHEPDSLETMMIKASFVGANPNPRMVGEEMMEYKCNYFLGNDQAKWRTDVPNYQAVVYEDIYPGIDLKYYGNGKQMEYDFIVSPGADPSQIMVQYEGARSVSVNSAGELVVETEWGTVTELKPFVYQLEGNRRSPIGGEYTLLSGNCFGFKLNGGYNPDLALVIDPVLDYSTYLGGDTLDQGYSIAVDDSGNVYITGTTPSTNFPTTDSAYDTSYNGGDDAFVTKLSPMGDLVYSTYLGGSDNENGTDIAVDDARSTYVAGWTYSSDFPTTGSAYDTSHNGGPDAFVAKLNEAGNDLVYSTYLGGGTADAAWGIAVDSGESAYVTGWTWSGDFPMKDSIQLFGGDGDAYVSKLNAAGDGLVYSTFLGGSSHDVGWGIAVDGGGSAYVIGGTLSSNFPTKNPFQDSLGGSRDAFVAKLNTAGNTLVYSTYLGGNDTDNGQRVVVDTAGSAYAIGRTSSLDFPTTDGAYDTSPNGGGEAFVAKLNPAGNGLIYSTYLGGSSGEIGRGIALDGGGNAYVTGTTESSDFPTKYPLQDGYGGGTRDAFVVKLNAAGDTLVYSTYLGGNDNDDGTGIGLDDAGSAYIVGVTFSSDFPTMSAFDSTYNGGADAFVTKISPCCVKGGDVDHSGAINVVDLAYLVDYLFFDGPPPPCPEEGDVDGSGAINVADLTYLVEYLFFEGPAPPPCP